MPQNTWDEFYEITKVKPPSPLLVRAMEFVTNKDHALDLGAGALKDTKFLLFEGFKKITAVDQEPAVAEIAKKLEQNKIEFIQSSFEDFKFPDNEYDLVNAQFALPFTRPESFNRVFHDLKQSLKPGGIFTGQFFGNNDKWKGNRPELTFHTIEEAKALLEDMEIIEFKEFEEDSHLANGTPKHWHVFHVIAKK